MDMWQLDINQFRSNLSGQISIIHSAVILVTSVTLLLTAPIKEQGLPHAGWPVKREAWP